MKNTYIILMIAAITMSTAYSQNNLSFKFGLPISSAQVLLKNRTILGKTLTPTLSIGNCISDSIDNTISEMRVRGCQQA